jgi:hypothetical protein
MRAHYFVSDIVQVAVAAVLTLSGPTHAAGNTMASDPDNDDVVAARVPVPENEHPGDRLLWAGTVNVTEANCAPETVPASVALTPVPASTVIGPVTLVPLWLAVHDLTATGLVGGLRVPVHVPARLSAGVGVVGELDDPPELELLPQPAAIRATIATHIARAMPDRAMCPPKMKLQSEIRLQSICHPDDADNRDESTYGSRAIILTTSSTRFATPSLR